MSTKAMSSAGTSVSAHWLFTAKCALMDVPIGRKPVSEEASGFLAAQRKRVESP